MKEQIGRYAFIVGLVISVIAGFASIGEWGIFGLIILGVIVGLLNVTGEEIQKFLLGTVALMIVGTVLSTVSTSVPGMAVVTGILYHFIAFVAGAALIVALKEVFSVTKSQ